MFKACAIVAVYNEEDIIKESVSKLISDGMHVYVIDNNSTDNSIQEISHLVGKGIIDIERIRFYEEGKETFNLTALLRRKEEVSKKLQYDWFLNVDADEIRYAPWQDLCLLEGLERVNFEGCNLINFKLFNFRLTRDQLFKGDFETSMPFYSHAEQFNSNQIRAWKKTDHIQFASHGGHICDVDDPNIYPVKFILKHYPVRSVDHGRKKINAERKSRFTESEKGLGWHIQYDDALYTDDSDFIWDLQDLTEFSFASEIRDIYSEGLSTLNSAFTYSVTDSVQDCISRLRASYAIYLTKQNVNSNVVPTLISFAEDVFRYMMGNEKPILNINNANKIYIAKYIYSLADLMYLKGNPRPKSRVLESKII